MPTAQIEFRPFQDGDLDALFEMYAAIVEDGVALPANGATMEVFIEGWIRDRAVFVAWQDDAIVGSFFVRSNFPAFAAHIAQAGYTVSRASRRQGIARLMVQESLEQAARLGYTAMMFNLVLEHNPSRTLYESFGFQIIGRIPHAKSDEDALIYWRSLEDLASQSRWVQWHADYDDPASSMSRRLAAVQRRLSAALDQAAAGPIRLISLCAGQGRDVLAVLSGHPRREDVSARLVELDPRLVQDARAISQGAGLSNVEIVEGDASTTAAYEGATPADVVLISGVFGNISDSDIRGTIDLLPSLCSAGATVIWTRHRRSPDLTPEIRSWFVEAGFTEIGFDSEDDVAFGVGTNRFARAAQPFHPHRRLFTFIGDGSDARF